MINIFSSNSCTICRDSISDPVCRECYLKQTEILLNDLNLHEIIKEIILRKIKNKFSTETLNDTECILCRKDDVAICRYCFSIILTNILRELNFTEKLIKNFVYHPLYEENFLENESSQKIEIMNK